jgi:type III secretion protein T
MITSPITADYVTYYINSVFVDREPIAFLSLLFLFFGRVLPLISLAPFFGAKVLPHPVKVTFALSLFVICMPQLLVVTKTPLTFNLLLVLLMVKEAFIGLLMGFMISIPYIVAQSAGMFIDHQRGGASLMVNDPTIQNQSSPLGTLFNLVLIFIFFTIDGPIMVIDALFQSYEIIAPDQMINPHFFQEDSTFFKNLVALFGKVMRIATQLAAPALIAILMTDFFLGVVNRLAPQVQITFLGMPLKSLLALVVIFFGWKLFTGQLAIESITWLNYAREMFKELKPTITS